MNSISNKLKVGDLVKIIDIDVREDWDVDGTPIGGLTTACPLGRIGNIVELHTSTLLYGGRAYEYVVDCGIGRTYIFDRRDLELIFESGF